MLYDFDFDWRHMVRGLTIDKRRGNVLKLDRHKYVKLAYHGFQKLSREQRLATYANALVRSSRTFLLEIFTTGIFLYRQGCEHVLSAVTEAAQAAHHVMAVPRLH